MSTHCRTSAPRRTMTPGKRIESTTVPSTWAPAATRGSLDVPGGGGDMRFRLGLRGGLQGLHVARRLAAAGALAQVVVGVPELHQAVGEEDSARQRRGARGTAPAGRAEKNPRRLPPASAGCRAASSTALRNDSLGSMYTGISVRRRGDGARCPGLDAPGRRAPGMPRRTAEETTTVLARSEEARRLSSARASSASRWTDADRPQRAAAWSTGWRSLESHRARGALPGRAEGGLGEIEERLGSPERERGRRPGERRREGRRRARPRAGRRSDQASAAGLEAQVQLALALRFHDDLRPQHRGGHVLRLGKRWGCSTSKPSTGFARSGAVT